MDQIWRLRESILGYLAPAKRHNTIQPSTPSASTQRPFQSMTEPKGKEQTVLASRVNKRRLSPSDTKRFDGRRQKRRFDPERSFDEGEDEIDASTDVAQSEILPSDSVSQLGIDTEMMETVERDNEDEEEEDDDEDDDEEEYNDDDEVGVEDKVEQFLDHQTEYEQRKKALEDINTGEWSEDEIILFRKISMRGFEPLLHSSWHEDFSTCPAAIFTDDSNDTVINARSPAASADFLAMKALQALGGIGFRVRGMKERKIPQEIYVKREIERYVKWSQRDGGYDHMRFLPVICLVKGHPKHDIERITRNTKKQLNFLAQKHRDWLSLPPPGRINPRSGDVEMYRRKPPIIYGMIIAHWIVVFVTLDSSNPDAIVRTVAHFDFSIREMDLWNAFAIAIMVITARDYTMNFIDEMEPEDVKPESDEDL